MEQYQEKVPDPSMDHVETNEHFQNPEAEIMMIMQKVAAWGRNDFEMQELPRLIQRIHEKDPNKRLSGKEAVQRAHAILNSKQDYN